MEEPDRRPAAPAGGWGLPGRLAALLRWEDLLVSAVAFAGLPLFDRLIGPGTGSTPGGTGGSGPSALTGVFGLVAITGVLACLCTRGPGEAAALGGRDMTFQGWARFPLMAGVAVVALETLPGLGIDPEPFVAGSPSLS